MGGLRTHDRDLSYREESADSLRLLVSVKQRGARLTLAYSASASSWPPKIASRALVHQRPFFRIAKCRGHLAERLGQELAVIMLDIDDSTPEAINEPTSIRRRRVALPLPAVGTHLRPPYCGALWRRRFHHHRPHTGQEKVCAGRYFGPSLRETPFSFGGQEQHIPISWGDCS